MAFEHPEASLSSAPALVHAGVLTAHREGVNLLAAGNSRNTWASSDTSRRIQIWDGDRPAVRFEPFSLWERVYGNRRIYGMQFSPDGRTLYVAMTDRLAAFESATGRRGWQYRGPRVLAFLPSSPVAVAVEANTGAVAAAFDDGHFGLWSFAGDPMAIWHDNETPRQLAFTRDGSRIVGTDSFSICIWEVETRTKVARHVPNERVHALKLSPAFDVAASRTLYDVAIWDIESGAETARIPVGRGLPLLAFSPEAPLLAYSERNRLRVCGFEGSTLGEWSTEEAILSIGFSNDGRRILVGLSDSSIRAFVAPVPRPAAFEL
ncbi:MAG TPA: hypothetical protein PLX06_02015 [Fimbriimonadaceae bacterium]|nr:hypothetical protein [Fimbriimonadaceae bacterium]